MYNVLDEFMTKMDSWKDRYLDDEDDVFEQFYNNEYNELADWYLGRSFDSYHLIGGPFIGCFRCQEKIKIFWESTFKLESGNSIWNSPKGFFEMPYDEFISSVSEFFEAFFIAMDKQVENAVARDWGDISLDKELLVQENAERKLKFYERISFLVTTDRNTDWHKIMQIYAKMEEEIRQAGWEK